MSKILELFYEMIIRGIWEGVLFLFGTLCLAKVQIPKGKFTFSALLLAFVGLMVRQLPISYGIHTMLILICLNVIAVFFFSVDVEYSIKYSLVVTCALFIFEGVNALALQVLLTKDALVEILNTPIDKLLYFIPSTLMLFVFDLYLYVRRERKAKKSAERAEPENQ